MDRRNFLRSLLGVAAVTALPSEVWPFRKIFLPAEPIIVAPDILYAVPESVVLSEAAVEAIELEIFARGIPELLGHGQSIYQMFRKGTVRVARDSGFHIPVRFQAETPKDEPVARAANKVLRNLLGGGFTEIRDA